MGAELRRVVAEWAGFTCEYCLIHEDDAYLGCEVDHIVSEKHEGQTVAENLAFSCFCRNRHKGSDIASRNSHTGELVRLFNPRADAWAEHFQLRGGRIEWRTSIGEVTARLLKFNELDRTSEREELKARGAYPSPAARWRLSQD